MNPDIEKLIELTTIVRVEDNVSRQTIFGDEYHFVSDRYFFGRFQNDQEQQVNLSELEDNWNNKWKSFGNNWNEERQNYRFLYDSFRLFYFSFEQLRLNKVAYIINVYGDKLELLHLSELAGVSLYGMYHHGKKCIDLLKILKLIDENHNDWKFLAKFTETRNKLIEHNYNPYGLNLQIHPLIWGLGSTNSSLEISIHLPHTERAFDAYVDYYEDYYQLEKIITDIIKKF